MVGRLRGKSSMCAVSDVYMDGNEEQLLQGFLVALVTDPKCHPIHYTVECHCSCREVSC